MYRRRYESRRSSKPKCHFKKYGEKRFLIWRMEFLHPAMWHDHDIDIVNRDSEFSKSQHNQIIENQFVLHMAVVV